MTRNVFDNHVTNATGLFGALTGSSPNITWQFSGGCTSGAPLTSGSYKIYYTNNTTGCSSLPAYFCAAGNGGNALAGSLTVPVITSPSNSIFTTATTFISGTADANASLALYVNGINIQNTTATAGGVFNFTGLTLLNGQQLYIVEELNTGTVSTSKCASQTAVFTVSCYTQPPLINADNNNQLTAGAPITGTSGDAPGTTIKVYTSANSLVATTTVQANGTWSTGNAGTLPAVYNAVAATTYYANAQNGSCGLSTNSASYSAAAATSAGRCGTISGPVSSGAAGISGTLTGSFSTTTVNLYLDDILIGSAVTSGTNWGPITVNSTPANTLYANGVLRIGIQESGKQEVSCPSSALTISCSPTPAAPVFSPSSATINTGQTVTYTISNAVSGSFYAIADSSNGQSLGQGSWASTNGNLILTTNPFMTAGTYKVFIKSTSLSGVTQCSAFSSFGTVTVNNVSLPVNLVYFRGKKQNGNILLDWATAGETDLNRFEIERSMNGTVFEKIGMVQATGFTTANTNYAFTDTRVSGLVNYYRLKIIDNDRKFTYSNVVVFTGSSDQMMVSSIKPNPFNDAFILSIELKQALPLTFHVIDMTGRILFTKQTEAKSGNNHVAFTGLSGLPEGIYFIKIFSPAGMVQQKILKTN